MDIGVPLRDLGPVDVRAAVELVRSLPEAEWTRNSFRQDALADPAHGVTQSILLKHEWHPSASRTGIQTFEDLVYLWAKEKQLDPQDYLPLAREDTDVWPVYTFPEWLRFEDVLGPLVEQVIAPLRRPRGVVTRLALVRLLPGGRILPHIDGHAMAEKAHRVHVPLTSAPSVEYKIDGRKLAMRVGHAYDFNNRKRHAVRNNGRQARVNLFVDYYADPGIVVRNPLTEAQPLYARPTPRLN